MIERGSRYLDALPEDRVLSMRFEDVVESPHAQMRRFIRFVGPGFEDRQWLQDVRRTPRRRPSGWHRLDPDRQRSLAASCATGQGILGYEARGEVERLNTDLASARGTRCPPGRRDVAFGTHWPGCGTSPGCSTDCTANTATSCPTIC